DQARAELIRLQLKRDRTREERQREELLLRRHRRRWADQVSRGLTRCLTYSRGFAESFRGHVAPYLHRPAQIHPLTPLRSVTFSIFGCQDPHAPHFSRMAQLAEIASLEEINLTGEIDPPGVLSLARSPHLRRLRAFEASLFTLGRAELAALCCPGRANQIT